jgi:hypothetical protein
VSIFSQPATPPWDLRRIFETASISFTFELQRPAHYFTPGFMVKAESFNLYPRLACQDENPSTRRFLFGYVTDIVRFVK